MARMDSARFIMNSDSPMPAQITQKVGEVRVPAGTQTSPTAHLYTDLDIGDGLMIRAGIKSSRNNIICPSLGQGLNQYEGDAYFSAWARCIGGGKVRCEVYVRNQGLDSPKPSATTSDNTFTFYISGFKLP